MNACTVTYECSHCTHCRSSDEVCYLGTLYSAVPSVWYQVCHKYLVRRCMYENMADVIVFDEKDRNFFFCSLWGVNLFAH